MEEMVVSTGAIRHAKPQSNCCHQRTPNFLQATCPSFTCPTNSVNSKHQNAVLNSGENIVNDRYQDKFVGTTRKSGKNLQNTTWLKSLEA